MHFMPCFMDVLTQLVKVWMIRCQKVNNSEAHYTVTTAIRNIFIIYAHYLVGRHHLQFLNKKCLTVYYGRDLIAK